MTQESNISLRTFISELSNKTLALGQKFVVMRNYQKLPDMNLARDIDIIIPRNGLWIWRRIISNLCRHLCLTYRTGRIYLYVSEEIVSKVNNIDLQIDIEPRMNWRGVDWINVDKVIERAILFKENIWIPHPADECAISFCMSYLYGGFVKEKYLPLMSQQAEGNREEVFRTLKKIFGRKTANEILYSLINQDIAYISQKATINRLKVLWRGFLRHPLTFIYTFCLGYILELRIRVKTGR